MSSFFLEHVTNTKFSPDKSKNIYSKFLQGGVSTSILSARTSKSNKQSPYEMLLSKNLKEIKEDKISPIKDFGDSNVKNEGGKNIYSNNLISSSIDLKNIQFKSFIENNDASKNVRKSMENLNLYSNSKNKNTTSKYNEMRNSIMNQLKMQNFTKNDENTNSRENSSLKTNNFNGVLINQKNQLNYFSLNQNNKNIKSKPTKQRDVLSPDKQTNNSSKNTTYSSMKKDLTAKSIINSRNNEKIINLSQNDNNSLHLNEFALLKSYNDVYGKTDNSKIIQNNSSQDNNIRENAKITFSPKKREPTRSMPATTKNSSSNLIKNELSHLIKLQNEDQNEQIDNYYFPGSNKNDEINRTVELKYKNKNESLKINDLLNLAKKNDFSGLNNDNQEDQLNIIYEKVKKILDDHKKKENQWNLQKTFYVKQIDYLNKLVKELMQVTP